MTHATVSHARRLQSALASALILIATFAIAVPVIAEQADILAEIQAEIIPVEGAETPYGIPFSLQSLPQFVDWWTTLRPDAENDPRYADALNALVAPCCDDNPAFKCCCENDEGQACNIIRSGKGLASHLILDLDYDTDQVRENVLAWFRFARWDYYVAAEMEARGLDPTVYGLTTEGSCYRGLCNTPISEGGCGGMQELIEPAIEETVG